MKKLFFTTLLLAIFLLHPQPTLAQNAGQACVCPDNTILANNTCVTSAMDTLCHNAATLFCTPTLNPGNYEACINGAKLACYSSSRIIINNADDFSNSFCGIMIQAIEGVAPAHILNYKSSLTLKLALCLQTAQPIIDSIFYLQQKGADIVNPTCKQGLICSNNVCIDPNFVGAFKLCNVVQESQQQKECQDCVANLGIWTAIGCLHTNPSKLISQLLRLAVSIAGGTSLIIMLFGVFQVVTSSGVPDNLQKGRETITNAIIGLVFVLFSVILLKIIGVDILQIPGL